MSQFYGTLQGNRGKASRCGSKSSGITTYATSGSGAVRVEVYEDSTGREMTLVELVKWHGAGSNQVLYEGPVSGKTA